MTKPGWITIAATWLAAVGVAQAEDAPSGRWSGVVTQVGQPESYSMILTLGGTGGTSRYPDLSCRGRLNLVAVKNGYAFYIETIEAGRYSEASGEGCIDGSVVVSRMGGKLAWTWLGGLDGVPEVAYAILDASR
jgi:hypothetical protein